VSDRSLNVALIGAGGVVRSHHLPGLRAVKGVEVRGVAGRDAERSRQLATELDIRVAYSDWRAALEDTAVDAVVIGTWPDTHEAMTVAALSAGKHVLCEARMATDHDAALRMLTASRQHPELRLMIVPAALTFWCDRTVERLLREGAIGSLASVNVEWGGDRPTRQHAWWRRVRALSGDNVMELGILIESIARWVGHPVRVAAEERIVDRRLPDDPQGRAADVPDHLRVLGELPGGASLVMALTPLEPPEVLRRRVVLTGSSGVLEVDLAARRLLLHVEGRSHEVSSEAGEPREWAVEAEFCDAVRSGAPITRTHPAAAERYMAVTSAVRRAAATGTVSAVPEPPLSEEAGS
jgi:predicted dehydrogenase